MNNASYAGQRAIKIGVKLRFLQAEDKPRVKELCKQFFPIDYPERWYNDITNDRKYFALSAVLHGIIVGVIVAEVKTKAALNRDDQDILASSYGPGTKVAYLLSLGVLSEYRENGIGSLLVDSLVTELRCKDKYSIKAVYLHVLCTNTRAIHFYEKRDFVQHKMIPGYYSINGSEEDGYCYVHYINGGQPPWSVGDYMKHVTSMFSRLNSCSHSHRSVVRSSSHSVHNYASNVLSKIPKMLPSLPRIPTIFTSDQEAGGSDPIVTQNHLYCDTDEYVTSSHRDSCSVAASTIDSGIHSISPTASSGGSRSLGPASSDSAIPSIHGRILLEEPSAAHSSSDDEYHDSLSSPVDLSSNNSETECEDAKDDILNAACAEIASSLPQKKSGKLKMKNFYPSKTTQQKFSKMVSKNIPKPSLPRMPAGLKSLLGDEELNSSSSISSDEEEDRPHRKSLSSRLRGLNPAGHGEKCPIVNELCVEETPIISSKAAASPFDDAMNCEPQGAGISESRESINLSGGSAGNPAI